jgi:hypothetical protein
MDYEDWTFKMDHDGLSPSQFRARLNSLESVVARMARDVYPEKTVDEAGPTVGQIPELTRLQRQVAELTSARDAAVAEARRWKQQAIARTDLLNAIAENLADIHDDLEEYRD